MALEREALTHKIEDDLALRNRNWNQLDSHLADYASQIAKTIKHIEGVMFGGNTSREFVLGDGTYLMISKGNNNAPSYFEFIGVVGTGLTHESIVPVNNRASIVYEGNKVTVTHVGWGTCRIIKIN
jgi:hypothetical protein